MFKTIKNPVMFWMFIIFAALNIADVLLAYPFGGGETNPIYLLTGNIFLMFMVKAGFIALAYALAASSIFPSRFTYFTLILSVMLSFVLLGIAVYSGLLYHNDPSLAVQAASIPKDVKAQMYAQFVGILYVLPFALCLLSFWAYDKSEKYIKYGEPDADWWKVWKSSARK